MRRHPFVSFDGLVIIGLVGVLGIGLLVHLHNQGASWSRRSAELTCTAIQMDGSRRTTLARIALAQTGRYRSIWRHFQEIHDLLEDDELRRSYERCLDSARGN